MKTGRTISEFLLWVSAGSDVIGCDVGRLQGTFRSTLGRLCRDNCEWMRENEEHHHVKWSYHCAATISSSIMEEFRVWHDCKLQFFGRIVMKSEITYTMRLDTDVTMAKDVGLQPDPDDVQLTTRPDRFKYCIMYLDVDTRTKTSVL